MASSPSEHEIQQRIRLACGRGPVRLWRNNTGALVDQQGRFVRFGLCKGSSDLIGLRALEITPEMVGQRLAQFVALEVKIASGAVSPEQRAFLRLGGAPGRPGRLDPGWLEAQGLELHPDQPPLLEQLWLLLPEGRVRLAKVGEELLGAGELPEDEDDPVNRETCQAVPVGAGSQNYAPSA